MNNHPKIASHKPENLAEELGKDQPFDLPEREAFLNLLRTADRFNREAEILFSGRGISRPQFNIIYALNKSGPDGLPVRKLARHMVTTCPDVTRLIDRLESAGLVSRRRIGDDRRVIHVRITAKGRSLFTQLESLVNTMLQRWFRNLTRRELGHLNAMLFKLRHPMSSDCGKET